ncbi:hypothetical protein MSG28_004310 [Choristoneura fumiferana]|uniref:Uncharacterized protein n=1 Tax=Choristoneura fumiferana TaxID=7141 RepID=A0ACC0KIE5_CHOFU|nr:hypothetical protein MSG28_004310 [Choristoneura fumiferana]
MADDDEIDVLGDFSFNSCLAQNNQGIPSCSNREDTVHPQWLLDSATTTVTNWYDNDRDKRVKLGPARKLSGTSAMNRNFKVRHSSWNETERDLLVKEMAKYGRNIQKIAQTLKTKTAPEIQALIEAEYGIHLETPAFGLLKNVDQEDVPNVVQEEIVTDDSNITNVLSLVATASPTITVPIKHPLRKKNNNIKANSRVQHSAQGNDLTVDASEIFYDDEMIIGSTESVGSDLDFIDPVAKNMAKQHKEKVKAVKKIGNHRRKVLRNFDKGRPRTSSKELLKSPQERRRKDSGLSEESTKSPKLQIVLGSGVALPVSEGEQVIKIEKKKDSESDSDIEIDIDSDNEGSNKQNSVKTESKDVPSNMVEAPIAVPLAKFEPMPKRQKKINLDGGGGYTIMHTAAGDLFRAVAEPRRERVPRPRPDPVSLIHCRLYNDERPAPYSVRLHVSALILMDAHAHSSRAEVMGLAGGPGAGAGRGRGRPSSSLVRTALRAQPPALRTAIWTPAAAGAWLRGLGRRVLGWHHSHPLFAAAPSRQDLRSQRQLQRALDPFLALLTSQHWPRGRTASVYRYLVPAAARVETKDGRIAGQRPGKLYEISLQAARATARRQPSRSACSAILPGLLFDEDGEEVGYQLRVRLVRDVTAQSAPALLADLAAMLKDAAAQPHAHAMDRDVCPEAKLTYLEKCISSVRQHLRSAGYEDEDPVVTQLVDGIRDIFR